MTRLLAAVLLVVAVGACSSSDSCRMVRTMEVKQDGSGTTYRYYDAADQSKLLATCNAPVADLVDHPELVTCSDPAGNQVSASAFQGCQDVPTALVQSR